MLRSLRMSKYWKKIPSFTQIDFNFSNAGRRSSPSRSSRHRFMSNLILSVKWPVDGFTTDNKKKTNNLLSYFLPVHTSHT